MVANLSHGPLVVGQFDGKHVPSVPAMINSAISPVAAAISKEPWARGAWEAIEA